MEPLVSVVVATYNQAWCIEEAIDSVLCQTYKNFEVIAVDDGSTDDTQARLAAFGDRIVAVRQRNQGINKGSVLGAWGSRNTGIRRARGELIAFLDGDDVWEPEKLAVQVAAAQNHPTSGLIVVDGVWFSDEDGRLLSQTLLSAANLPGGSVWTARLYKELLCENFICTPSQVMVPSKVFDAVGLFHRLDCSDYDLYIRIAARYDVTLIGKRLTRWRYHGTSLSGPLPMQPFRFPPAIIRILKKQLKTAAEADRPLIRQQIRNHLLAAAEQAYERGRQVNRAWASRYLWRLLLDNPESPYALAFLAALWCPRWLASLIGPVFRRTVRPKADPSGSAGDWRRLGGGL